MGIENVVSGSHGGERVAKTAVFVSAVFLSERGVVGETVSKKRRGRETALEYDAAGVITQRTADLRPGGPRYQLRRLAAPRVNGLA